MKTGNVWDIAKITLFVAGLAVFSSSVWADAVATVADRIDQRGDTIEDRLDDKGDRIDRRLDRRGDRIDDRLDNKGDRIDDLHVWSVGPGIRAAIISVATDYPRSPEHYKALLPDGLGLVHVTVEVHDSREAPSAPP